ncbi:hypothetical protein ERJ75_001160800 [Trypanosoma vivax]|nr:hypothetical protein TRVL_07943 [Trypanosoma vivax]KAH8609830.1 hypothetical protein ERJ75_001160800 [Trypanosoma vivax]
MPRAFEEVRITHPHRSVLLDHVLAAPKRTNVDRLCESLPAKFRSNASKDFWWPHRVVTRKTIRLEHRWRNAQDASDDEAEKHSSVKKAVDGAEALDLWAATGQSDSVMFPLRNMSCLRRCAGVVREVNFRGQERDCASGLGQKAGREALKQNIGFARTCVAMPLSGGSYS